MQTSTALATPSDSLTDKYYDWVHKNCIKAYVPWTEYTSKSDEQAGAKEIDLPEIDPETGVLKIIKATSHAPTRLDDHLLVSQALTRRSAALDIVDLVDFETPQLWTKTLVAVVQAPPVAGYVKVTLEQAQKADRKLWENIASDCRSGESGVQRMVDGSLPVQASMKRWMWDHSVRYLLNPLPATQPSSSSQGQAAGEVEKLRKRVAELEQQQRKRQRGRSQDRPTEHARLVKGKSKGKGRPDGRLNRFLPPGLRGGIAAGLDRQPRCFNFNLPHGCPDAPPGGRCAKGLHACMFNNGQPGGCGKATHGMSNHS